MIYVFGIFGFIFGAVAGFMLLYVLLRHKSNDELLNDKSLKLKFGILAWGCAAIGAYVFVQFYEMYFTPLS